jgi:hypothetical protein
MSRIIRWVLVLPAALAAWYAALFISIALYEGVEALCPFGQVVSGQCVAPWFVDASDAFIAFGAALAAALVVSACTFVAPTHRRHVAIATFVVGAVVAIMMGWATFVAATITAIISGAVVLVFLLWRLAPVSLPNNSLDRTRDR